ncbi:hypothetical protein [Streptomyces xanthophaeus]
MSVEDTDIHPLEQIAAWVGQIWPGRPKPTHLLFQMTKDGEACGLRAVRRVGTGYVHVEKRFASEADQHLWMFDEELPWAELAAELEGIMEWDRECCPALAKESGGWWRLALCPQFPESEVYQAYEAHTVIDGHDPGAVDAGRGYDVLQAYLTAVREGREASDVLAEHIGHVVTVISSSGADRQVLTAGDQPPSEGTAVDCVDCRTSLSDQWGQPGNALATGGSVLSGDDVINAVTALLHYADGWHGAQAVLDRALRILIQGQQMALALPDLYDEDPDPRTLDAVAGAIAAHYASAARFHLTDSEVAQHALARFRQEIEEQRLASLRVMRAGLIRKTS